MPSGIQVQRDAAEGVIIMAPGGSRNRSGPKPDPDSGRSDLRGYSLTSLPAEGYTGKAPDFPLPGMTARESVVWSNAWRTPQACAWSMPSESWRINTVALWVRLTVRCEDPEVGAAFLAQLHRFADQIGMTTAGLAEMGWKVAVDEVAAKGASRSAAKPKSSRDRMNLVKSDGA